MGETFVQTASDLEFERYWSCWVRTPSGELREIELERALNLLGNSPSSGNYIFFFANLDMPTEI